MTFLEIAQPLAQMGIPITPVRPGTKRAFLPDFPTTATTDLNQITEWNKLYSDHNAACVARAEENGVWFWEVDAQAVIDRIRNDTGHDVMTEINTFKVRSRSKRGHFYFRHDADSLSRLSNISQTYVIGQDWSVRTNREYVVAPGSIHPDTGKPYEALNWGTEIKTAPKWLIEWLLSQKIQKNAASNNGTSTNGDAPRNENNKIPHGSIHGYMLTQAGKLRAMGLDADGIEGPLLTLVHANCEPPIDESKVRQMARSICNFEAGTPNIPLAFVPQQPAPGSPAAEQAAAQEAAAAAQAALTLPRSCLASSYLGELYDEVFAPNGWTLELALPALVTAASVLIPKPEGAGNGIQQGDMMTSLYTALIAPVHGGKSQVEEWSARSLGIYNPTRNRNYTKVKFGSAEQMWKYLHSHSAMEKPQDPKAFTGAVLINPDEWSHVMAKAGIPDASFSSTLTSAFYSRSHIVTLGGTGGGRDVSIPFSFSIIGGIVKDDFDSVFSSSTIGGLYDRFLFGLAPEGFHWSYRPFPASHPFLLLGNKPKPVAPTAHPSLSEAIQRWNDKDRDLGRIVEVCVRVATIFAGIDGRKEVTGDDLDNLWGLALYQKAIRGLYKPNAGTNPDAIFSNVALNWVNQHAKEWRTVRDLQKGTNYHRRKLGPNVAYRALQGLAASDEVELWVSKLVEDKDGKMVLNNLPPGYTGKRPRLGGALVKVASPE